jgi:type IV pilus assembly protein PilM
MDINQKKKIHIDTKTLQKKLEENRILIEKTEKEKTEKESLLRKQEKEEKLLAKQKNIFLARKKFLEKRLLYFSKKEMEASSEKKKIERIELEEKNPEKRRKIEKNRWDAEENRRKIEKKKWKIEDKIKAINKKIREFEEQITGEIKTEKRSLIREIEKQNLFIKKKKDLEVFFKKHIVIRKEKETARQKEAEEKQKLEAEKERKEKEALQKAEEEKKERELKLQKEREEERRTIEKIRETARQKEAEEKQKLEAEKERKEKEALQKAEEEKKERELKLQKEREEERRTIEKIRETARQKEAEEKQKLEAEKERKEKEALQKAEEESGKEKSREEAELQDKLKELFHVIDENKKEISSLRAELNNREQESGEESDVKTDEKRQMDVIREKVKEEYERLAEKERTLRRDEDREEIRKITKEQLEEEKRQIDYIRERVMEERARMQDIPKTQPEIIIQQVPSEPSFERNFEKDDNEKKKNLEHGEAEALFKKAEQSFLAGSFQTAKIRFRRIVDYYEPEEGSSLFGKLKSKPLNERAAEYLQKIEKKEGGGRMFSENDDSLDINHNIYQERKRIESRIKEILEKRNDLKEKIKEEKDEREKKKLEEDFIELEKERTGLEKEFGENIVKTEERKESLYTKPQTVIREIIREKQVPTDEIRKEMENILKEKEELKKREALFNAEKEKEADNHFREIKEKEKQIEAEKKKLEEEEKSVEDEGKKEEIRKRKEEMENMLRKLIEEETNSKWGKKISEIENEIAIVNKKYNELTKKERNLQDKIKEMSSWGPDSRKKEKEVSEYRSLYKSLSSNKKDFKKDVEEIEKGDGDKYKKRRFLGSLKPSKDFFLKNPYLVAVDISDYSIEIFCINKQKTVLFWGRTLLEQGVVYNGEIRDEKKLREKVVELLKKTKPNPIKIEKDRRMKVIFSLPESKIFIQQVKVRAEEKTIDRVKEEIERTIPVSIEDLYFYYHTIFLPKEGEKMALSVATEKRIVKQYIDFFQSIDTDPIVFDLEATSLGRSLLSPKEKNKKSKDVSSKMIVDIGARTTTITFFYGELLSFSVGVLSGGADFTEKIAKELNIPTKEAEERKLKSGLKGETKEVIISFLEDIIREIKSAERYYEREFGSKVNEVILAGGSALLPGVLEHFKNEIGETVKLGNPLEKIKTTEELKKEKILLYANVIGLAMRTTEKDPIEGGINMLPERVKKTEKRYHQERRIGARLLAVFIAILGVVVLAFALYHVYNYSTDIHFIEDKTKVDDPLGKEITIYSDPTGSKIIKKIYSGYNYEVLRKVGDWEQIDVDGVQGWIKGSSLD